MYISGSDQETVDKLQALIKQAEDTHVETTYMEQANNLNLLMNDNIEARKIMEELEDYNEREYPEPDPVDPKTGKPLKPKDDKKKKKKKRKEPAFPLPNWASGEDGLQNVQDRVKKIDELAKRAKELQLEQDFLEKVDYQLKRFKKEIAYRKQLELEEREEAEARALAKKKKKTK